MCWVIADECNKFCPLRHETLSLQKVFLLANQCVKSKIILMSKVSIKNEHTCSCFLEILCNFDRFWISNLQ